MAESPTQRTLRASGLKRCPVCKVVKPFSDYHKSSSSVTGCQSRCIPCHTAGRLAWWRNNKQHTKDYRRKNLHRRKEKDRWWNILKKYGITKDEYVAMLAAQGGKCLICGSLPTSQRHFSVDHCHETGRIRGILCAKCNTGIGLLGDDVERLKKSVAYLEKHK